MYASLPGWGSGEAGQEPSNHPGEDCLSLSSLFEDPDKQQRDVDYFFWSDTTCGQRMPFICEQVAEQENGEQKVMDCIYSRIRLPLLT